MVLSLFDLSLRAILNGIENGTIQHPQLLPPKLRERVFDTAIKQGLANHLNGLAIFTSVEFLTGMTSISAEACRDEDVEFVERLAASLATELPNGKTIGAAITKLNLKVHEHVPYSSAYNFQEYRLLAQCQSTKSLDLRVINERCSPWGYWPLAWIRRMKNLVELSLRGWTHGIDNRHPMINFGRLTTLKLDGCSLTEKQWVEFLENVPLLENLHLIDFDHGTYFQDIGMDSILPFSLPHLKSLELIPGDLVNYKCNKAFVDNLIGCPQLRQVRLMLDEKSTDEESHVRLASMDTCIDLKVEIRLCIDGDNTAENAAIFDSSSRFKLVHIFHEKMNSFSLHIAKWDPQISTALEDVVATCSALTDFAIYLPWPKIGSNPTRSEIESEADLNRFNEASVQFFGTLERALQLKYLFLSGNFDEAVISAVFKTCLNLARLEIKRCSALRDQHLIDWVSYGGGNLTRLDVVGCDNVTNEGIIPILAMSAERLLYCDFSNRRQRYDDDGRDWATELYNHCPNANVGYNYPRKRPKPSSTCQQS